MKHRPILFSTDMVRAILGGRKTQTRRIKFRCEPGDILWVRETFLEIVEDPRKREVKYIYKADMPGDIDKAAYKLRWKPGIHMPREAARLFLRVEEARVERLQDISQADILREGIRTYGEEINTWKFRELWDSLNANRGYGWDANPLVKVIAFGRMEE